MLFYHPSYSTLPLPPGHRFPVLKYRTLLKRFEAPTHPLHPMLRHLVAPTPISEDLLKAVHAPEFVDGFLAGTLGQTAMRRIGFPQSDALLSRTLHAVGGTYLAAKTALYTGIAMNLSGGYHHAHHDFGSGFCIFNDAIVAANALIKEGLCDTVLVFDCDVHQGDGTAAMAAHRSDIITCSIHCDKNFPSRKPDSDYDFALPKGAEDTMYLNTVKSALALMLRSHQPDCVIYNAGVDILEADELGFLNVSKAALYERDAHVISTLKAHHIPLVTTSGGGYQKAWHNVVDGHEQLFHAVMTHHSDAFV